MSKIAWSSVVIGVQPRVDLMRSFDERHHSYLGYVLVVDGSVDGQPCRFTVRIGPAAQAKHCVRPGVRASGLAEPAAKIAIRKPAAAQGVEIEENALQRIVQETHRYPYFLQEWGKHAWDTAVASPITLRDDDLASATTVAALDESFFRVRFDRLTPVEKAGIPYKIVDQHVETASGHVSISSMHLAKGLEFRAVAMMACDDEIIPLQQRIETVGDDADLQAVYDTECHLLYVACARARDHLLVTSVAPASEFLDHLRQK